MGDRFTDEEVDELYRDNDLHLTQAHQEHRGAEQTGFSLTGTRKTTRPRVYHGQSQEEGVRIYSRVWALGGRL